MASSRIISVRTAHGGSLSAPLSGCGAGAALPAPLIVPAHAGTGEHYARASPNGCVQRGEGGGVTFAFLKELIEILKTDWKLNGKKGTA